MVEHTPASETRTGSGSLRILIAATPKTGNIWLKHLLAAAYSLEIVEVEQGLDDQTIESLGSGWVAHQHLAPTLQTMEAISRHNVVVLTVLRHPCDVLVSLKSYLGNLADAAQRERNASAMLDDGEIFAERSVHYVRSQFAAQINLSLMWWKAGAIPVRFEDLRADPVGVLRGLSSRLGHLPEPQLRAAVALTNIGRMRMRNPEVAFHFRRGQSGGWHDVLPPAVIDVFRTVPPFPAQFAALGYTLDPQAFETPTAVSALVDPFRGSAIFDNGVAICDLLVTLYFSVLPDAATRWPEPLRTDGPDSYFGWLNAPCESDPRRGEPDVLVTNLAFEIHRARPDLQRAYRDLFGLHRLSFVNWFLIYAMSEYSLDLAFLAPVFESIARVDALSQP